MAAFLRAFLSLLLATVAAYAFSFAIDIVVGVWVGVYSTTAYLPVVTWSVISGIAIFLSSKITRNGRWLALPYVGFGLLAGFGGLVGHRRDLIVAGAMLLHAFLVWRAFSRTTIPGSTKSLLHSVNEQRKEVARAALATQTSLNGDEITIVVKCLDRLNEPQRLEHLAMITSDRGLDFEKLLKLARHIDSLRPQVIIEQRKEAESALSAPQQSPDLEYDEMTLLVMLMRRLDEPAQLASLERIAAERGLDFEKLLKRARAMNDAVPQLPYDRGKPLLRSTAKAKTTKDS